MASSLSTGLTGLLANQQYIDTVGNNIANSNTPGYKSQQAVFSELFSQTLRPASGPGSNVGGTNPVQFGLGVRMSAVLQNVAQGALTATGRALDLAIEGSGFFALSNGTQRLYTRVGTLGFDSQSNLVDLRTGLKVLSPTGGTINVNLSQVVPPKPTTSIVFKGNLPAEVIGPKAQELTSSTPFTLTGGGPAVAATNLSALADNVTPYVNGDTIKIAGFESDGTAVTATFTYGTDGTTVGDLVNFLNANYSTATAALAADGSITLTADASGKSQLSLQIDDDPKTNWTAHAFDVSTKGADPDTVTTSIAVFDPAGISHNVTLTFERQDDLSWNLDAKMPASDGTIPTSSITSIRFATDGTLAGIFGPVSQLQFLFAGQTSNQSVNVDLGTAGGTDGVTQFGDESSAAAKSQDGYTAGTLANYEFDGVGQLIGFFTNGIQQELAQVGVAMFANQEGLSREGETLYAESVNSGQAILGEAQSGGAGVIRGGAIEGSNVDIASEFVNLIQGQRGFQANARVITTTDELLSELVNIIR